MVLNLALKTKLENSGAHGVFCFESNVQKTLFILSLSQVYDDSSFGCLNARASRLVA
jgi:hypothetical protein